MASLANQTISSTYDGLVKTSTDQPVGVSGVQLLEDGVGNSLALSVGRANQGVTVTGPLTGTLSATSVLADGVIATTQATSDNSTKVATTAYVKSVVTAEDLDIAGDSGTGAIDLDSQTLTIEGTANEIETSASGQTITIGLPSTITANVTGDVTGDLTGDVLTAAQANITSVGTLSSLAVSGNLTVDTNTLFVDAADNWVGIGTTTRLDSATKFQITSNTSGVTTFSGNADDVIIENNANLGITLATPNTNSAEIAFADPESTQAGLLRYNHSDDSMQFRTSGSERMRIDSTGNVGIGTSTASTYDVTNLVVEGSTLAGITISESTGAGTARLNFGATAAFDSKASISCDIGFGTLYFSTLGAERMRIDSSGSVLIGETSISGFSSPNALRVKGGVHSNRGQFSAAGSTTTNILTLANESKNQTYLLSVRQAGGGANYALAFVVAFGASASVTRIIQDNTNPVLDLDFDVSGLTVRLITESGYGATTWDFVLTRLG